MLNTLRLSSSLSALLCLGLLISFSAQSKNKDKKAAVHECSKILQTSVEPVKATYTLNNFGHVLTKK
jgi:hypothetical protein